MVQGRWFPMGAELTQPLALRKAVFGRERDALDDEAQQVVVYEDGQPVGAARLWWREGAFWLGDVGVLAEKRGRGYGDLLVRLLLFKSLTHHAEEIRLETPRDTLPFFTQYGFEVAGEPRNGLHPLRIRADDVHLSHCGGNCAACEHQTEACIPKALRPTETESNQL